MRFEWSTLGSRVPESLVEARILAHHAVQWVTKAARANLSAASDDSHSSLDWRPGHGALLSRPIQAGSHEARVGLRLADLQVLILSGEVLHNAFSLGGKTDSAAGAWVDSQLHGLGLRLASSVSLPYSIPDHAVAAGAAYAVGTQVSALEELSRWYAAGAEALDELRASLSAVRPGPGPVRCWPHHFDIATLVKLEESQDESARSVGIGLSPGDEFYAQPYAYVSPWPHLKTESLPNLPPPGHWHTQGFVAAVATASEILTLAERKQGLLAFLTGAFEIGRARLGA